MSKSNRQIILAKLEAVYGTDPVPTVAADSVLAYGVKLGALKNKTHDRAVLRPFFGGQGKITGGEYVTLDFEVEAYTTGVQHNVVSPAAGFAPAYTPLLEACALSNPVQSGVTPTFISTVAPISAAEKSITLVYANMDGRIRKLTGARGTVKLKMAAGSVPMLAFSFTGIYNAPTEHGATYAPAALTGVWKNALPVQSGNTSCTLHAYTGPVAEFNFDLGNQIVFRDLINSKTVQLTGRKVTGSVTIEEPAVTTKDFDTIVRVETLGNFVLTHGQTVGQKFIVSSGGATGTGNTVQIVSLETAEAEGIRMLTLGLEFIPTDLGNNEFNFVFG